MAQNIKLDMGKAWTDATTILSANLVTVATIGGLFLFLPYFAMAILVPEAVSPEQPDIPPDATPDQFFAIMQETMSAQYSENWLMFLLVSLVQFVGSLSLLALMSDRANPTVAEALQTGAKGTPIYLASLVLLALGAAFVIGIPLGIGAALQSPLAIGLVGLIGVVAMVYIAVKFILASPVIAIEEELNPLKALKRSWQLTKGNSLRIFFFLLLLFILIAIISGLVVSVFGLVFAVFGGTIATIGNGFVAALSNGVFGVLFAAIYAAIYRQLSGPSEAAIASTFE